MTNRNNEDVPSTIAGFYYQALLACRELSQLVASGENESIQVGIERGADVKVRKCEHEEYSIEAKFYGSNFNKKSDAITHTIFNFYKNSFNDEKLIFETNVAITDDDNIIFSRNWVDIATNDILYYLRYLKFCLIKESLGNQDIYDKYVEYKKKNNISSNQQKYRTIEKLLDDDNVNISDYLDFELRSDNELELFLRKFEFRCEQEGNPLKQFTIKELKNDIRQNISIYIQSEDNVENILNVLIDSFFCSTVEFTQGDSIICNIKDRFDYISVGRFKQICTNQENEQIWFLNNAGFNSFLEKIEVEENTFLAKINTLIERRPSEINTLNQVKNSYYLLRKKLFANIDSSNYYQLIKQFSFKNHTSAFVVINLLKYLSTLVVSEQLSIDSMETFLNRFSNIEFEDKRFLYKFSECDDLEDYINAFIVDTFNTKDIESDLGNVPIIVDYRGGGICNETIDFNLITDIANYDITNNDRLFYRNCDYRCNRCLKINKYLEDKDKFSHCPGINNNNNE